MAKKDINKDVFTEETMLKLEIFRQCFREWYPVFVHNKYISHVFVYDMFAGSGKDTAQHPGSPITLFQEARGDKRQHCRSLLKRGIPFITFGYNELDDGKRTELESNVFSELTLCKSQCIEKVCPFQNAFYFESQDFSSLINNRRLNQILTNAKYAKFILLDQYGFKQINDDVFLKLVNSPTTDFIFFIASSFIKRFKDLPAVTTYFNKNRISFDETQPKECHKVITDYFRSLIPANKKYYLHSFTIQKGSNYYGLIFGSAHSLGMEKFVKVCWKEDRQAGESNCNLYNDFEPGTLFYDPQITNKKTRIFKEIKDRILDSTINDNITGLDYALECGCEPKLFVDVMDTLINENRVKILGKYNKQATNIHKANTYKIELK
ncbi:MAG: three-Cys-motif partner protein TcmP [Prevotella sp.]|nr:three-Cys-motif partner protein TcmP [Prevotella sp.]